MRIAGFADDFLSGNVTGLYGLLKTQMIAGGTLANLVGSENHPGIMRFANEAVSGGGYNLHTETDSIVVTGKETIEYIFKIAVTTNCVARLGFHDTLTTSSPTDGLYLFIGGTTLNGRSFNNTATSTTGSSYTITQGDWYRGKVQVNADATRCDYFLYSEAGALVWHDYLTTNLPVGRNLGIVIQIYNTSSGAANTGDLDYLAFWCDRVLTR
jgi:hypothetical protein